MESFSASLKKELVHHGDHPTREQARATIFEYIEVFYNRVRRHSALGYVAQPSMNERITPPTAKRCPLFVGNST
jgi:transposase InsO family protein